MCFFVCFLSEQKRSRSLVPDPGVGKGQVASLLIIARQRPSPIGVSCRSFRVAVLLSAYLQLKWLFAASKGLLLEGIFPPSATETQATPRRNHLISRNRVTTMLGLISNSLSIMWRWRSEEETGKLPPTARDKHFVSYRFLPFCPLLPKNDGDGHHHHHNNVNSCLHRLSKGTRRRWWVL